MRAHFVTVIFFVTLVNGVFAQPGQIKFNNLTINDGLSFNTVHAIVKDEKGLMWFGTQDGLNKYNGYNFLVYKNDPKNRRSISHNDILVLFKDKKGNIWIGTNGGGLALYNSATDDFDNYLSEPDDSTSLSNNSVTSIYEDEDGIFWIGTYYGLNRFDPKTKKFKRLINSGKREFLSSNTISSISKAPNGRIWVSTYDKGLNCFDRKTLRSQPLKENLKNLDVVKNSRVNRLFVDKKSKLWIGTANDGLYSFQFSSGQIVHYAHQASLPFSIPGNGVNTIEEDEKGNFWIGLETKGLCYFDVKENKFYRYKRVSSNPNSITSNSIRILYKDNLDKIWIGTYAGGVNIYDKFNPPFFHYKPNTHTNIINTFAETADGNLWIGTDGDGFCNFNRQNSKYSYFRRDTTTSNSLSHDGVVTLFADKKGKLWIGTYGGGVNIFDPKTRQYKQYLFGNAKQLDNRIYAILEDKEEKFWIGTLGAGLKLLDTKTGTVKEYRASDTSAKAISNNFISSIIKDKSGDILIGTYGGGLNIYNRETDGFTKYTIGNSNIGNQIINTLFVDRDNELWLGTMGGGLKAFDRNQGKFVTYDMSYGLSSDVINGIQEDDHNNLWISTNKGISKFSKKEKKFVNYDMHAGLQSYEFRKGSSLKTSTGEILFGGIYGFNMFHPDSIKTNPIIPEVILTGFQVFNKPVEIGPNSPLKKDITETSEIVLNHDQTVFTIEFACLNFTQPEKNQYAFKLEGFDKDWNYVGYERKATYTNLNPGTYTFHVIASNNDGVWNKKGLSIKIEVTPPYWKTWWFFLLILVALITLIYLFFVLRTNELRKQQRNLEQEVKKQTEELRIANVELILQKEEMAIQTRDLQYAYTANKAQGEKLKALYFEVRDSIKAAQEIQKSILPASSFIKEHLADHFILYKPKDVVSGDFYWFDVRGNNIILASVDCTGHGVSGAFMSMNGHHLLNKAIYQYEDRLIASEILDRLNDYVIKSLHSSEDSIMNPNGLDIGLCIMDKETKLMQYAGAHHPLYILRNKEIIQVKGDRFSIGASCQSIKKYKNNIIQLKKADMIYMFSDGFADQIGGENGDEKFLYYRFRDLLLNIVECKMDHQKAVLDEEFELWKGDNEQLDDVLVIGFKV